ncbi:unnamed protein product [Phytophthora fragariaefolia]|uniref:Unnamed protein product n=1 Tax=Phytophthora fragariaefolia TaxID=1490495 RepID=A0A9W6XWN2_9STRA|nr:unnamed protein product [Phytophthora fragariaefolia]
MSAVVRLDRELPVLKAAMPKFTSFSVSSINFQNLLTDERHQKRRQILHFQPKTFTHLLVSNAFGLADHFGNNAGDGTASRSSSGASDLLEVSTLFTA